MMKRDPNRTTQDCQAKKPNKKAKEKGCDAVRHSTLCHRLRAQQTVGVHIAEGRESGGQRRRYEKGEKYAPKVRLQFGVRFCRFF